MKKFDQILGNPPYGKNANLAIRFVNEITPFAESAVWVLPRTMRKDSTLRKLDNHLHLTRDSDNPLDTFEIGVFTCTQTWELREDLRVDEFIHCETSDFTFSSQEDCDICIGRVGLGGCGKTYFDPENRSVQANHFIKVKSKKVIETLQSLEGQFRETAMNTAGNPSLTRQELKNIYVRHVG